MRMVCLLRAVTPAWVTDAISLTLVMDYILCSDLFGILHAKIKCLLSVEPARPVLRTLNKHYSARGGPINLSFMYFT